MHLNEGKHISIDIAGIREVELCEPLGEGAQGRVWKVKPCAAKHANYYVIKHIVLDEVDHDFRNAERIRREASVSLDSEYVIKCLGFSEPEPNNFILLFPFEPGDTLKRWIQANLKAPWHVKKTLFLKILQGVRALHQADILHRDLKPQNILINAHYQTPRILDFGISKFRTQDTMTKTGKIVGTDAYIAPDVIGWGGAREVDERCDVYALGIVLYELIMGQNPWQANGWTFLHFARYLQAQTPEGQSRYHNILDIDQHFAFDDDPLAVESIRRSTMFEPLARFQHVDEMLAALSGEPHPFSAVRDESPLRRVPRESTTELTLQALANDLSLTGESPSDAARAARPAQRSSSAPRQAPPNGSGAPRRRFPLMRLFSALVILALIIGGSLFGLKFCRQWSGPAIMTPTPTPTPVQAPAHNSNRGARPTPTATPTPVPTTTPTLTPTPTVTPTLTPTPSHIALWLEEAEESFEKGCLLTADGRNCQNRRTAFELYDLVLQQEPANATAQTGLYALLAQYADWFEKQLNTGNCASAEDFAARYRAVAQYVETAFQDDRVPGALQGLDDRLRPCRPTPTTELALQLTSFTFETVKVNERGEEVRRETRSARQFTVDLGHGVTLEMVAIPAGEFWMGSPETEKYHENDETQHNVTVSAFYLSKYEITQAQWAAVAKLKKARIDLDQNPARFQGGNRPVEQVSWDQSREFAERVSALTGAAFTLPTEAQWEYACRAETQGTQATTPFATGPTITSVLANYDGNYTYASEPKGDYPGETRAVGTFPANPFGLYDMHGNVWEWVADTYDSYPSGPTDDRMRGNLDDGKAKGLRVGSWYDLPRNARCADRGGNAPDDRNSNPGFRVAASSPPELR